MASSIAFKKSTQSKYPVKSLTKALNILDILGGSSNGETLTSISGKLRLGKSTVHRLLATLRDHDFVWLDSHSGNYLIGAKVLQLSEQLSQQSILIRYGEPVIEALMKVTNETINLGVLEGNSVLYIIKKEADIPLKMSGKVGKRFPAHCTAMGKVLLAGLPREELKALYPSDVALPQQTPKSTATVAELEKHLEKVRQQGVAFDNEELYPGVVCIAAPVRNHQGQTIAAISLSLPKHRLEPESSNEFKTQLLQSASHLSRRLGYEG
jgi:DNA-binding IclR family transcriptional regulator